MSKRIENPLKGFVLALTGLMFYAKISDGTLNFYINQRFAWLSLMAVLLFLLLALTLLYRLIERRPATAALDSATLASPNRVTPLSLALLALPALLGLLVPARPLGASAISSKGIGLIAPDAPQVTQVRRAVTGPRNILDWLREFQRESEPATAFKGQPVDVIGFVYRDGRAGENQFWVSRFSVSCCVADATALGLLVQTEQAKSLKTDAWVRVTGKLGAGEFAGQTLPIIFPDKIEPVSQPAQPYLYP